MRVENTRRIGAVSSFGTEPIYVSILPPWFVPTIWMVLCTAMMGSFCTQTDIQLTAEEFGRLEASTINRVRELQAMIAAQRDSIFGQEFMRELRQRQEVGERVWSLPRGQDGHRPAPDVCMGCGRPSTVKIAKICDTCPERAEVGIRHHACFCTIGPVGTC